MAYLQIINICGDARKVTKLEIYKYDLGKINYCLIEHYMKGKEKTCTTMSMHNHSPQKAKGFTDFHIHIPKAIEAK